MAREDTVLEQLNFRVPRYLKESFKKKFPRKGTRTTLLNGFLQMLTDGRMSSAEIKFIKRV